MVLGCEIMLELDDKAIGKRIKIARIRVGLTQENVADRIGITPQHVSNIETGNSSVSLTTLVAMANLLNVTMDELLCDTLIKSKDVFCREADAVLRDCNEYEVRVLVDILKAAKESIRSVKIFQQSVNEG